MKNVLLSLLMSISPVLSHGQVIKHCWTGNDSFNVIEGDISNGNQRINNDTKSSNGCGDYGHPLLRTCENSNVRISWNFETSYYAICSFRTIHAAMDSRPMNLYITNDKGERVLITKNAFKQTTGGWNEQKKQEFLLDYNAYIPPGQWQLEIERKNNMPHVQSIFIELVQRLAEENGEIPYAIPK
ncbi:MAG: hypothetical protein MJA30_11300 [Cytophagales bacterium]|nr:hypothetical protein [Cytophagales bacterium]